MPWIKGGYATGKSLLWQYTIIVLLIAWGSSDLCLNADISAEVIGTVLVKETYYTPLVKLLLAWFVISHIK